MKKNKTIRHRNIIAFCLTIAVFVSTSMVALGAPEKKSLMGELIVSGPSSNGEQVFATLNGERAFSGRTFFSSGTISTSEETTTTIKLGKLGFINLSPNSNLSLSFTENSISGTLSAGQINVFNNEGVEVNIKTPDAALTNENGQSGNFTVDLRSGLTKAAAESGTVYLNNGKTVTPVQTGQKDDDANGDGNSALVPIIVFSAIVATAVIYVLHRNNDDNVVSPLR